jgi:acyl-CoA thioesterase I
MMVAVAWRVAALLSVALLLGGCSSIPFLAIADRPVKTADRPVKTADRPVKIVVLGDSLGAGFGLPWGAGFSERLGQVLSDKGIPVTIVNAGISGDTASDGLRRLGWSVPRDTEAVIIELGGNDAERGIDPNMTQTALASILRRLQGRHIQVLLAGFCAPASKGPAYVRAFAAIYPSLASSNSFVWYPDILDGVASNSALFQLDGEHPNADGVNVIVERILPQVEQLIARARAARRT